MTSRNLPAYEPPHLPLHRDSLQCFDTVSDRTKAFNKQIQSCFDILTAAGIDLAKHTEKDLPDTPDKAARQELLDKLDAAAKATADAGQRLRHSRDIVKALKATETERAVVGGNESDGEEGTQGTQGPVRVKEGLWGRYQQQYEDQWSQYDQQFDLEKYGQDDSQYAAYYEAIFEHQDPEGVVPARRKWFANPNDAEDSESDLEIASEKISFICPLTYAEFVHPVSHKGCPHSYEREAIMGYFQQNRTNDVECPHAGCSRRVLKSQLRDDPKLLRKMERAKEQERRRQEREALESDDDDEEEEEAEECTTVKPVIKNERRQRE